MMTVNLSGMSAIQARMQALSRDVATKTGQAANRAGAAHVAKKIAAAAPDGPDANGSDRTRTLKNGAKVTTPHAKINKNIKVKRVKAAEGTVKNQITSGRAYHAMFVEFGSIHNQPDPFFSTTFENEQQAAIDKIAEILKKRLTQAGV